MSLRPTLSGDVPTPTATVARATFPRGNPYLYLRDRLGTIFTDAQFALLFTPCGQPAECPWRLALVTLLQFAENLSDRRAADAVRSRIDWKYLHVLTAAAMNLIRLGAWFAGTPLARTRQSAFTKPMMAPIPA